MVSTEDFPALPTKATSVNDTGFQLTRQHIKPIGAEANISLLYCIIPLILYKVIVL